MIHLHEHRYEYMEEINEGILKQLPKNGTSKNITVLDIGCGSGALSEAIQLKGYCVWGIESNEEAAARAAKRITKVICADLTAIPNVKDKIGQQKFDYIVFSDVLEHLYDPFSILTEYMSLLKKDGRVLISVPNVAVWTSRLKLLFGVFNYADTGLMDRTHIRFFTFKNTKILVRAAGCSIEKVDYTPYIIRSILPVIKKLFMDKRDVVETDRRQLIDSPAFKKYMKYIYPIEYGIGYFFKGFFAFRIIIVGKK